MTIPAEVKKWLAIGSGAGIEVSGPHGFESLHVSAARGTNARANDISHAE